MAIFKCNLFSQKLYASTGVNVVLPLPDSSQFFFDGHRDYPQTGQKYPVLYLLHGLTADFTDWCRFSGIERYAQDKRVAVVMPSVDNSFYCDLRLGGAFCSYCAEELPRMMQSIFPISAKREYSFVAGLSMGGFGALKVALLYPERFAAAVSLSGALESQNPLDSGARLSPINSHKWRCAAYGAQGQYFDPHTDDMATVLKDVVKHRKELPLLYMACGTEDYLYKSNVQFRDLARDLSVPLTYEEGPGVHNWAFWDEQIRKALDWLPLTGAFADE